MRLCYDTAKFCYTGDMLVPFTATHAKRPTLQTTQPVLLKAHPLFFFWLSKTDYIQLTRNLQSNVRRRRTEADGGVVVVVWFTVGQTTSIWEHCSLLWRASRWLVESAESHVLPAADDARRRRHREQLLADNRTTYARHSACFKARVVLVNDLKMFLYRSGDYYPTHHSGGRCSDRWLEVFDHPAPFVEIIFFSGATTPPRPTPSHHHHRRLPPFPHSLTHHLECQNEMAQRSQVACCPNVSLNMFVQICSPAFALLVTGEVLHSLRTYGDLRFC